MALAPPLAVEDGEMQFLVPLALEQRMLAEVRLEPHAEARAAASPRPGCGRRPARRRDGSGSGRSRSRSPPGPPRWRNPCRGTSELSTKRNSACCAVASDQRSETCPISASSAARTIASDKRVAWPLQNRLVAHLLERLLALDAVARLPVEVALDVGQARDRPSPRRDRRGQMAARSVVPSQSAGVPQSFAAPLAKHSGSA